jgi:hypothetical protein
MVEAEFRSGGGTQYHIRKPGGPYHHMDQQGKRLWAEL